MKRTISIYTFAMLSILLSGCTQNAMPQTEQPFVPNGTITPEVSSISTEDAKQIALNQVPGATTENISRFETDYDNGRLVYDGEIHFQQNEYDFEIDAQDGTILEWDVEPNLP